MQDERIRNIAAGGLLGFLLDEIGPVIHNEAVDDLPVTPYTPSRPCYPSQWPDISLRTV